MLFRVPVPLLELSQVLAGGIPRVVHMPRIVVQRLDDVRRVGKEELHT